MLKMLKMNYMQLAKILEEMHSKSIAADNQESSAMIHLFGIKYAEELKECGKSMEHVAKAAGIRTSQAAEIRKGIKLSKFVTVKDGF
jgi:5-methylcytosine-specific restriction protein B